MTRSRGTRTLIAPALALITAAALAACGVQTPVTQQAYTPTDGVDLAVGDLDAQSLVVLTAAEGDPGTVIGALVNGSDRDMTVTITLADGSTDVDVPAMGTTLLGPRDTEVVVPAVPAAPGALVPVTVTSDTQGSGSVDVPVLDGTLAQYADLVPAG